MFVKDVRKTQLTHFAPLQNYMSLETATESYWKEIASLKEQVVGIEHI